MAHAYTHKHGKGAGKYNGMARAGDWKGARIRAARQIRNGGGDGVSPGTPGVVTSVGPLLSATFEACPHCGTVLHVASLDYSAVELADQ